MIGPRDLSGLMGFSKVSLFVAGASFDSFVTNVGNSPWTA